MAQGQLSKPWDLHSCLHFLMAPAGFLGQRPAPVSMAGFVRTPRTERRTKGPQWTCHSHTSKAGGGAGWGTAAPVPPAPAPGWTRGDPWAAALGGHQGFGTCGAALGMQWGCLMEEQSLNRRHPEVAATPRPSEVVQEPDPDVPPVLISCVCSQLSTQLGWVSFPFHLPYACRASEAPCPGSAHTALCPSSSCADHREPQTTQNWDQGLGNPGPNAINQRRGSSQHLSTPWPR